MSTLTQPFWNSLYALLTYTCTQKQRSILFPDSQTPRFHYYFHLLQLKERPWANPDDPYCPLTHCPFDTHPYSYLSRNNHNIHDRRVQLSLSDIDPKHGDTIARATVNDTSIPAAWSNDTEFVVPAVPELKIAPHKYLNVICWCMEYTWDDGMTCTHIIRVTMQHDILMKHTLEIVPLMICNRLRFVGNCWNVRVRSGSCDVEIYSCSMNYRGCAGSI